MRLLQIWQLLALCWLVGWLAPQAVAADKTHSSDRMQAALVFVQNGVSPNMSTLSAGLDIQLNEDWKTYWRSPGEVGLPPVADWAGSENIRDVTIQYPTPTLFQAFGIDNFGYKERVVLPLQVTLKTPGAPARLSGKIDLLVCAHICVPETVHLSHDIPAGTGVDHQTASLLADWAGRLPQTTTDITARYWIPQDAQHLILHVRSDTPLTNAVIFPEIGASVLGTPHTQIKEAGRLIVARYPILHQEKGTPLVTVSTGQTGYEVLPSPSDTALAPPNAPQSLSGLWMMLGLALLGGLILNVMPCVLPVLSIKLTGLIAAAQKDRAAIRTASLASAAGIMSFMWLLALSLILMRMMGFSIGWGIQFQSPVFLSFILIILCLFTANMLGLFEISLPHGWTNQMDQTSNRRGLLGSYLTGAFAALMATPCSAPFLGTAITFALTRDAPVILLIFTALGLGLALPYLLIALRPRSIEILPKPGRWMLWVKWVLATLLAATAVWIAALLGQSFGLLSSLGVLALIALCLILIVSLNGTGRVIAASAVFAATLGLAGTLDRQSPAPRQTAGPINWVGFDQRQIAPLIASGQTVFVDVTADWCLTCKANKKLVLNTEPVSGLLNRDTITAFQADWTRPDPKITAYLSQNDRFGIPFNMVYGPAAPSGIALPELLTKTAVTDALNQAAGSSGQ